VICTKDDHSSPPSPHQVSSCIPLALSGPRYKLFTGIHIPASDFGKDLFWAASRCHVLARPPDRAELISFIEALRPGH
jgi:hypothetical protein